MKTLIWNSLDAHQRRAALARPQLERDAGLTQRVDRIIEQVRADGDDALRALTRRYDEATIGPIRLSPDEIAAAVDAVDGEVREAIASAIDTLRRYHRQTAPEPFEVETAPGVTCGRIVRPIRAVGLYVPAGSAPLPSTVLMLGVPASLAGCREISLCSPPDRDGRVDPVVVAAAQAVGIDAIYRVGGAQAIAALAFGTESIPACDKIFGPGNAYVTCAKQRISQHPDGAAIDMPAGPSEVLVIADDGARPEFVAADLLSQAEHGPDSQSLLITPAVELVPRVESCIAAQLESLPRADIARRALEHSRAIIAEHLEQAFGISNRYAPEHLIIQTRDPETRVAEVAAAGSVFLGPWAPEALGDYCSGTNHVLPTHGWARAFSGLSVDSFVNKISVQQITPEGLRTIGPTAEILAATEGLEAHRQAVTIRRRALEAEGRV